MSPMLTPTHAKKSPRAVKTEVTKPLAAPGSVGSSGRPAAHRTNKRKHSDGWEMTPQEALRINYVDSEIQDR